MKRATAADGLVYAGSAAAVTGSTLAAGVPGLLVASGVAAFAVGALVHLLDHHDNRRNR